MSQCVNETTDADFETDVLKSNIPVLVDFGAEWCQPCRMMAPVVDEIAVQYKGRINVFTVNVDNNSETASKYNVRGIPSLLMFKNGNVVATKVGALSKSQLAAFVEEQL